MRTSGGGVTAAGGATVLYCTVLYCTVLHCTVLYCTVLYCTVLYCTVLQVELHQLGPGAARQPLQSAGVRGLCGHQLRAEGEVE